MDMVQNYHVTDFAEELDAFVECIHEATLSHEGKREYIKYLFERWTNDDPAVGTFADQYEDALWKLCTDDADLRYWRDLLSPELPTEILDRGGIDEETGMIETTRHYRIKRLLDTYADLLDALDDEATLRDVYKQYYLDNRDFCLQYARQLSEADETDRAIEIAEEGLETFSNAGALRRFLIDVYTDRDPERCKTLLREQFLQSGDWNYYEQLQSLCSEDVWEKIVAELETELESANIHQLIQLYLHEGRTNDAFEAVIEAARSKTDSGFRRMRRDNGLAMLSEYRDEVAHRDPKTYYETYEDLLDPFLADTTGRDHYQTVIAYLEEMRELGFDEEFKAFVAHLKEKHSNRPAFLDEMETLEN